MGALPKLMFSDPAEIRAFRKKQGMNQMGVASENGK